MPFDQQTLEIYNGRSAEYAKWSKPVQPSKFLLRMIDMLPPNGTVLDFGCGAGWDAAAIRRAGFSVTAIDGSSGLVEEANRLHGIGAICITFDRFDMIGAFDGVWASFSLQHVPRESLPAVLKKISRALKPRGVLLAAMHAGKVTRRDSLGRLYCHQDMKELPYMLGKAGFSRPKIQMASGKGFDGTVAEHLYFEAAKRYDS